MADKLSYLDELLVTPRETGFGTMGNIIAQNLPGLVNPYASPGANFATVLGGGLLAGLLKYGAKQEAESQNAALMPKLLDVMGASSQQELQTKLAQPGYEQLGGLGTRLSLAMADQEKTIAAKQAEQTAQLARQQQIEEYKATLMNNPDVQEALRNKLSIQREFAPPSTVAAAAAPPNYEQIQQEAQARARGKGIGEAEAALSPEAQKAAMEKSELKTIEDYSKQQTRLQNEIKKIEKRAESALLTEEQKQVNRKELQQYQAELKQVMLDKQIAVKYDLFEKKWNQTAQKQKLGAADKTKVDNLMIISRRIKDVASKMRQVPNYASLKMADFLPMFDKNLAIADLRDAQSLEVINRTGAAAAAAEFERLQKIIYDPRATPAQLVARLERFVELATLDAETIVGNVTKSPEELIGAIRDIRGSKETFAELQEAYKTNKISKDDYTKGLLRLKLDKNNGQ